MLYSLHKWDVLRSDHSGGSLTASPFLFLFFTSILFPMSYTEILVVLIVGFFLGYIFGIEIDPKVFPQPVQTKVVREQILPDTTSSIAELVSVANRSKGTKVSIGFIVETKASAIFFEKNLKWLGYKTDQPDSSNHKTFFKDDIKGVQIASVYYAP